MINTVIFSKDRPAQLDMLLRSMQEFYLVNSDVYILWVSTDNRMREGYKRCFADNYGRKYNLVEQNGDFKEMLTKLNYKHPYTMFLVDDIVFKARFSTNDREFRLFCKDDGLATLSLRLAPHITFCYAFNRTILKPALLRRGMWKWRGRGGDWRYTASLDGHIYRTKEILPLLKTLNYKNPNTLEGELMGCQIDKPRAICYDVSKVVNLPFNKVQTDNSNRNQGMDAKDFLNPYLAGKRLDYKHLVGIKNESVHIETEPVWV